MALWVTFPKNEDVVAFERKNEMLVLLVSKSGTYKKELGNYAGYWLRKMYWKDLHCRGMQISRNALTHVATLDLRIYWWRCKLRSWERWHYELRQPRSIHPLIPQLWGVGMNPHLNVKVNKFEFASTLLVYIKSFTMVCVCVCRYMRGWSCLLW